MMPLLPMWTAVRAMKWLPYALVAVGVLVLVWRVHSAGYDSGYAQAEGIHEKARVAAMEHRLKVAKKVAAIDMREVTVATTKRETIKHAIHQIHPVTRPDDPDEWLRVFNEGVRAANLGTNTPGTDSTVIRF